MIIKYAKTPLFAILAILAVSCATTGGGGGEGGGTEIGLFDALPRGAVLYGTVNLHDDGGEGGKNETAATAAASAAGLLEAVYPALFDNKRTADFIKKSDRLVFGVYPAGDDTAVLAPPRLFAAARGAYPAFSWNLGLSLSPRWKSEKNDGQKWQRNGNTALLIRKNDAYIKLDGGAGTEWNIPIGGGMSNITQEDETTASRSPEAPDLSDIDFDSLCSVTLSREAALQMLRNFGIPLEMPITGCTLSIEKAPDSELEKTPLRPYISKINIRARSSSEAKAFQAILSLARSALLQGSIRPGEAGELFASLFLVNPPEVKGSRIVITGAAMSESIIARLASFLFAAHRSTD